MKNLAVFDLDGTITTKDTMFEFIKYTHGTLHLCIALLYISPLYILTLLGVYQKEKMKEALLSFLYKNWLSEKITVMGNSFAEKQIPLMLNNDIYSKLLQHKENGDRVIILTASCSIWVEAWCKNEQLELISSILQIKNGVVTGKLYGLNCHGKEKVVRLAKYVNYKNYNMYAYGNAPSDTPFIELANYKNYI
jgi:HAD superfamily hydrolase (TIGR01490 family)